MGDSTNPIPSKEPEVVRAGDTWAWTKSGGEYTPALGWALKYAMHCIGSALASNTKLTFTATPNAGNNGWDITVAAATTSPLIPGDWKFQAYVENGAERYTIDVGQIFVEADLNAAAAGSQQTANEKMLGQIQTLLLGRTVSDIESYQIAGRAVNKMPIAELVKLENIYLSKVKQERNPGKFGVLHEINFVRPS